MALMLAPTIWRFPCDVILIQIWCVCVCSYLSIEGDNDTLSPIRSIYVLLFSYRTCEYDLQWTEGGPRTGSALLVAVQRICHIVHLECNIERDVYKNFDAREQTCKRKVAQSRFVQLCTVVPVFYDMSTRCRSRGRLRDLFRGRRDVAHRDGE